MSDPTLLTMLIPGSVWFREATGKQSVVLFVTNQALTGALAEKNPSQVVFMTEKRVVLSQSVDQFLSSRTYFTMEPAIENVLNAILSSDDEDDVVVETEEEETVESATAGIDALAQEADEGDEDTVFDANPALKINVGPHQFAELLQRNFVAYEEAPFYTGDTQHKLTFALEDGLTIENIKSAFFIKDPNAIQKFVVTTPYEATMVDVDSYVDTLLGADEYRQFGILYLVSSGDFRAQQEPIESIQLGDEGSPIPAPTLAPVTPTIQLQVNASGLLSPVAVAPQQANNI